jgi:hypothetical protein
VCFGQNSFHVPQDLEDLYDECNRGRSLPTEEQLAEVLFNILNSKELTYVIIDGIDECPLEPERSRLEELVLARIGDAPGRYNFLFTSRKERDIEEYMQEMSNTASLK